MDARLRDELLRLSTTHLVIADRLHAARTLAIFDLADAIRSTPPDSYARRFLSADDFE